MFESHRFIQDCRDALCEANAHATVKELVTRAVSEPDDVIKLASLSSEGCKRFIVRTC